MFYFGTFIKNQWIIHVQAYLWDPVLFYLWMCLFSHQYHSVLIALCFERSGDTWLVNNLIFYRRNFSILCSRKPSTFLAMSPELWQMKKGPSLSGRGRERERGNAELSTRISCVHFGSGHNRGSPLQSKLPVVSSILTHSILFIYFSFDFFDCTSYLAPPSP